MANPSNFNRRCFLFFDRFRRVNDLANINHGDLLARRQFSLLGARTNVIVVRNVEDNGVGRVRFQVKNRFFVASMDFHGLPFPNGNLHLFFHAQDRNVAFRSFRPSGHNHRFFHGTAASSGSSVMGFRFRLGVGGDSAGLWGFRRKAACIENFLCLYGVGGFISIVMPLPVTDRCACSLPRNVRTDVRPNYQIVMPFNPGGFCANVIAGMRRATPRTCRAGSVSRILSSHPILLKRRFSF